MKNILIILFLLNLVACTSTSVKKTEPVVATTVKKDVVHRKNIVDVIKYTNFTEKQVVKTEKALDKITEVYNSKCFSNFMLKRGLIQTNGKTPSEVIKHLITKKVNAELIWYYKRFSKVHGFTQPGVKWIKLNAKYHTGTTICDEGSNIAHEASHKIGYGHDFKATKRRPYSVPYSINSAFKACCKNE